MTTPRKEYPRPDFVRKQWHSLNGTWQFTFDGGMTNKPEEVDFDREIQVPFVYQSDLSGIGEKLNTATVVWYKREFSVPSEWQNQRVMLNFGAVDHEALVWVNGSYVGSHRGGYTPFALDVTDYLVGEKNEVIVKVIDEHKTSQPRGKQSANLENWRCWYTRVTGIWQSVWLEPVADIHLTHLRLIPDIDNQCLMVEYELNEVVEGLEIQFTTSFAGREQNKLTAAVPVRHVRQCDLNARQENQVVLSVTEPKLWSPEEPNLYDLTITLVKGGQVIDQVDTYFGMRKVEARGNKVYLNNRPYYLRMVLDQGFWPDGIYTTESVAEIEKDVELIKACGFNGVRKHQKIEDPYFYRYCDTHGILVWAEMPSCYIYDEHNVMNITGEWQQVVRRLYNFPSIMAWVPMNESWGVEQLRKRPPHDQRLRHHLDALYNVTKALDPTRLVISNDGWQLGVTDIIAIHDYTQEGADLTRRYNLFKADRKSRPFSPGLEIILPEYDYEGQPILITEYGGVKVADSSDGWGYGTDAKDLSEMLDRMRELTDAILAEPEICGYCYTQLTDVQQEVNGLFTFDRTAKVEPAKYAEIFGRNPEGWR